MHSLAKKALLVATVLIGKLEVFIFKEAIHEDDEFAHTGGDCDQWFFTCGPQALIEVFEDAVVPDGTQGGHIEGATHWPASAADVSPAPVFVKRANVVQ